MNRTLYILLLFAIAFVFISCATSMKPGKFLEKFPNATNSYYYDRQSANEAISNDKCKLLVDGRKYTAPIGITLYGDVHNGAVGVDEWVQADGGNAYTLNNYEWIDVGDEGATQLIVYFDTMLCE